MEDVIQFKDQFYILATSSLMDDRTRVLKHGETFAVFDRYGDIQPMGLGNQGLYHEGTRFLSLFELRLGGERPLLLSSTVTEDNILVAVDLTNLDISLDGEMVIPRGTLHIFRSKFLLKGMCLERLRILNYGSSPVDAVFSFRFDVDYADIFEVRGMRRRRRGRRLPEEIKKDSITFAYEGLDSVVRRTRLEISPPPRSITAKEALLHVSLLPRQGTTIFVNVFCELGGVSSSRLTYDGAYAETREGLRAKKDRMCEIYTSNEQFNDWINRSISDLHMMTTETPAGPYPYAGVPWYSTAFGRDGIITALEAMCFNPEIARGVLAYLAETQAKEVMPEKDAEPGKILHETRRGEMATLGEIPFGLYYGSVDATPLFVVLAGAYYDRTGDKDFIESIWPNIELALKWIDEYGDMDGDGFIEYLRRSRDGLIHQGWKDSRDSVFHADGTLAEGPIALCEVQGYVYDARVKAAKLARVIGQPERADVLWQQARMLKDRFEKTFWCEDLGLYALALDGKKRLCRVRTSNAGHCLLAGIASHDRALRTADTLLSDDFFSGWGIRTVAASEALYNPMSYHNGSVWPHDNALIAYGLARYGFKEHILKILTGLFDASIFLDLHRLPELFCGFVRRRGEGPTLYPVACAPQSWAVASVFLLLKACLGLYIDAPRGQISFSYPLLPEFLQEIEIKNLRVGRASVDFLLRRYARDVSVNVLRREGPVEIVVIK